MAAMESQDVGEPTSPAEARKGGALPADRQGLLKHSREFLDFFWDIAKPQQETRLEATEKLLEYLRTRPEGSEMKYALKRLITGLGVGRETARPCYSLALAQLLQSFEDIPLCSILQQIQERHDLQKVKKAMMRPALFANLFGVLALFQSGRLMKDPEALMKSVKLLQGLAQHHNHLQEQPQKALVDILSEVPEAMLQEILPKVLKPDMNSVLSSPEHLELFLLAQQKVPEKLKKLMGSVNLFSTENMPRLVTVLKTAAIAVKKERRLPTVALDLLRLAQKEDKFLQFWKEVVEQGLLQKHSWPASYLCFRLLGAALPLLSHEQLQLVMQGDLIRHYGEHMVTSKLPNQFKFAPEMNEYVGAFLEGCRDDPERQLAMVVAFTSITNQGLPVMPTFWRVVRFLSSPALKGYVAWLRDMFLQPDLDSLVDFSTTNQKKAQEASLHGPERAMFRLRKWIILRLVSIVDNLHVEKEEALVEEVARFCFFHAFFETKTPTAKILETEQRFSFPLDSRARQVVSSAFFSLLQTLSTQFRQAPEQTQDKQSWTYRLIQFADMLLNHGRNVTALAPFTTQQRQTWDRMLQTLKELEALSSEAKAKAKATAFQHLLLLVAIHLFKSPAESCDILGDIQTCIKKSLGERTRRTRSKATNPQEPPWVEVLVEILLALLAQPSHLIRQVARSVFSHVCSHLTPHALQLILNVLSPDKSEDEDDNVVVMDDCERQLENEEDKSEDNKNSESEEGSDEEESDEEARDGYVDQGFREQLMAVLQSGKALGGVDSEDDNEEELGDEAMMALDQNLSSLFAEQKLRIQARRDEKNKLQKEKMLRRDFQIRVLDLIEVLVTKQPENPLVLDLLEPLLNIIRRSMRNSSSKQEQDLLHKTARIFTHHLCRSRHYCHDVSNHVETLYPQVERLVQQAGHQADSSISFYYFNASLYLLRVLKGSTADRPVPKTQKKEKASTDPSTKSKGSRAASCLDLSLVTPIYSSALTSFLTRRNSPLAVPMFLSLFSRHPALCKSLLPIVVQHVTGQTRPRHQVQACILLQKALMTRELRLCFEDPEWEQLIGQVLAKVTENLHALGKAQTKSEQQKELSSLELLNALFRIINHEPSHPLQRLTVDLTAILGVLQSQQSNLQHRQPQGEPFAGFSRLYDLYWRPKSEKKDAKDIPSATPSPMSIKRKKKGFLPETKKRKKRKLEGSAEEEAAKPAVPNGNQAPSGAQPPSTGKKKRKRVRSKVPAQSPVNGTPATKSLTSEPPTTTSPSAPAKTPKLKKKNRKLPQENGATPVSPVEAAGRKQHLKEPSKKGVSGKSLPRKKARLSLAARSPSLLRSGASRRRAQLRKGRKP
nr:myb-binding protein 1A isoform X3 [Manis javanica]